MFSAAFLLLVGAALAQTPGATPTQTPAVPPAQTPAPGAPEVAAPPRGEIIIQSHGDAPSSSEAAKPAAQGQQRLPDQNAKSDVSDAERSALTVTSYDLDARLNLARSGLSMRARMAVRNDGPQPLKHIALQISSSLHWENASLVEGARRVPLQLAQHTLDTDTDHTGAAAEAVLALPQPLAPGASASLDLFYSGSLAENGDRLARLGANAAQQNSADWDAVSNDWTGIRGFGNVLWYPVASPQLFMAEGNSLFAGIGRMRLREENAAVRLRLSLEYVGEPPVAAYFCGRRADLKATPDDPSAPTATGAGIASAEFAPEPLGFRTLSLFVIKEPETLLSPEPARAAPAESAALSSSSNAAVLSASPTAGRSAAPDGPVVALASTDPGTSAGLAAAAGHTSPLLAEWLGARPLSALTVLDHPGQPYQDGPLLVAPAAALQTSTEAPALVYSMTHAWVQTGQPWIDEGLAQFFALLWVERENGRAAAVAQLADLLQPVALAEPNLSSATDATPGQPIVSSSEELFYRRKAAAVWWMLRDLAGEQPLRATLAAWRTQPASHEPPEAQAVAFQHALERLSGKDLGWFFNDWVLRDRGLPDLTIADVQTGQTPAGPGHNTGWLVAVTVHNDGGAVADVPLIVRSGQFSSTQRIRIPGFSQTTQRVLVEAPPTEVIVNDGGTPELRASTHTRLIDAAPQH